MSNEGANAELVQKQKDLNEKLANFKGGDEFKSQIEKLGIVSKYFIVSSFGIFCW